ncbi:MAG: effector binding domain-containing protein [Clostridiales bacterium]|nr:effector binding domain-containing protein [Clostridiales bacterium]
MELQTISQISKQFNISTRTLRYYEQIGLIRSTKKSDFAYRMYDVETIARLQQIVVLRKLRIPLRQIAEILQSEDAAVAIAVFQQSIREMETEIAALSTIKSVIQTLLERLQIQSDRLRLPDDESLLTIVNALHSPPIKSKENKTMEELHNADEKLNKLTDKDIRIVFLPPSFVAAYRYVGEEPENHTREVIETFVRDANLPAVKPDLRHYGFNAPNPDETGHYGYEMWVTIPETLEVPAPLLRKQFAGGLYAAHMIPFGAFEEWAWLDAWLQSSEKYAYNGSGSPEDMFGCLEESLNYVNRLQLPNPLAEGFQLDLLMPIREKE